MRKNSSSATRHGASHTLPSLSVYTRALQRPPPSSIPSLPPNHSLSLSLSQSSTAFCPLPRLLLSLPGAYWTQLGRLTALFLLPLFLARSLGESPVSWSQADSGGVQKHHPSGSKTSTHTLTHSPISLGILSHNSSRAEESSATTPPYVISTQTTSRARERERQRQRERQHGRERQPCALLSCPLRGSPWNWLNTKTDLAQCEPLTFMWECPKALPPALFEWLVRRVSAKTLQINVSWVTH